MKRGKGNCIHREQNVQGTGPFGDSSSLLELNIWNKQTLGEEAPGKGRGLELWRGQIWKSLAYLRVSLCVEQGVRI